MNNQSFAESYHSRIARFQAGTLVPLVPGTLVVLVLLLTSLSGSLLRYAPGAVVPWGVHGLVLAALITGQPRSRIRMGVALFMAAAIGVGINRGDWIGGLWAAAHLISQAAVVAVLHGALSGHRHPLHGTRSYWYLGVAIVLGSLPTNLLAAFGSWIVGPEHATGFSLARWWTAAVTSMAAVTPIVLTVTAPLDPHARRGKPSVPLLLVFMAMYGAVLANVFFGVGDRSFALTPIVAGVPFLVWAGLQYGLRGYARAAIVLMVVTNASAWLNLGAFAPLGRDSLVPVERAWVYLAALIGPAMIFPVALEERAKAEARARGAFAQLSAIIESSGDLIAAVDRDLVLMAVNPAWVEEFARISGTTALPGMRVEDALAGLPLDAEEAVENWRRAIAGEHFSVTRAMGNPDLAREEYEITFSPVRDAKGTLVGASQVVRNVTLRRRQESADAESRRLEALGRLAGGVAHDFNNLMTAVIGYTGMVIESLPEDDSRRSDLDEVDRAARRAGELTQQLLAFARRRMVQPRSVDVGELVRGFTRMLAPLLGTAVRLEVKIHDPLPPVRVDPLQFEQVLMNLAVNARDAMPSGGALTVTVAPYHTPNVDGVRLSVRDTGSGIAPEVLSRIWEPFYTTKPLGQGTGLGLSTVHGIVHQAGGEVTVESTIGVGTTIHVVLPSATTEATEI